MEMIEIAGYTLFDVDVFVRDESVLDECARLSVRADRDRIVRWARENECWFEGRELPGRSSDDKRLFFALPDEALVYGHTIHPAAARFPVMKGEEFAGLVESIRANGLREPITRDGSEMLDGRNRYLACIEAGVEPTFEDFPLPGDEAVKLSFILDKNARRRNLTPAQRALIGLDLAPEIQAAARHRQRAGGREGGKAAGRGRPKGQAQTRAKPNDASGRTNRIIAKAVGVSHSMVARVTRVAKTDADLAAHVKAGDVTLPEAEDLLGFGKKPDGLAEVTERLERIAAEESPSVDLECLNRIEAAVRKIRALMPLTN